MHFRRLQLALMVSAMFCMMLVQVTPAMAAGQSGSVKLTSASVTPFTVVSVGGGTWNHGSTIDGLSKKAWSNYLHPSKYHSATTIIENQQQKRYASKGAWANTTLWGAWTQTAYAYWATY
jgi:lactococcin 972 family bacteriocin